MKRLLYTFLFLGTIFGCSKTETTPVTPVTPKPTTDFAWTESTNGTVQFTNSSKNADSYQWDFGDNLGKSTSQNPKYTFEFKGNYQVKLVAKNSTGESEAINTVNITTGKDPVPIADFSWSENSGIVTFSNKSQFSTSYSWDFGDGSTKNTEVNPKYTFKKNQKYSVVLTANGKGGTNLKTIEIDVKSVPDARDKFVGNWKRTFQLQGDPKTYTDLFTISKDSFTADKVLIVFTSAGASAKWEATIKVNTISYIEQPITELSGTNDFFFAIFTCNGDISNDGKTVNLTGIAVGSTNTVKVIEVWTKQ